MTTPMTTPDAERTAALAEARVWDNKPAGSSSTIADTIADGHQGASPTLVAVRMSGGTSSMTCPECGRAVRPQDASKHARSHDPVGIAGRFWSKVDRRGPDECWEWQGTRYSDEPRRNYGQFVANGRRHRAHRFAWELANGPMPAGLDACHRCDNPPCVNPGHIFPGTMTDNVVDAVAKGRIVPPPRPSRVVVCRRGHLMTPANTYIRPGGHRGYEHRECRACKARRRAETTARRKEARAAIEGGRHGD